MIFLVQVRLILKRMILVLEIVNIENNVNFKFSFFVVESDDFRFKSDPYI
jgi:hypothetical protein